MNIYDLMTNSELSMLGRKVNESDDNSLEQLLNKFRNTTGEFKNASHKFYTVRKALANELEGDEQENVKKISPSEFFNYLKSKKTKPNTTPSKPIEEPKQNLELRGVTREELDEYGTVYAVINKWVDLYHPKYSANEIAEVLFKSAMGSFEELPYIRKEVQSAIISKERMQRVKKEAQYRPSLEKKFKVSKQQVEELLGSDIYKSVLNDMVGMVKNQARVPGDKPTPAHKMYGYIKHTLEIQYDRKALDSYMSGDESKAKEFMTKRSIVKNVSSREFKDWYSQNK